MRKRRRTSDHVRRLFPFQVNPAEYGTALLRDRIWYGPDGMYYVADTKRGRQLLKEWRNAKA